MTKSPVHVSVAPRFIPEQSSPDANKYFFSYTITIVNSGTEDCQLISRHWLITDGDGKKQEVMGEGVIGKQPIIKSGESFTYTSGVLLETQVGTMHGTYHMLDHNQKPFDVEIEPFLLAFPGAIN